MKIYVIIFVRIFLMRSKRFIILITIFFLDITHFFNGFIDNRKKLQMGFFFLIFFF